MSHLITYTVADPPPGVRSAVTSATYSDAEFAAVFSAEDQATLIAGGTIRAKAAVKMTWPSDVLIEEPARKSARAA